RVLSLNFCALSTAKGMKLIMIIWHISNDTEAWEIEVGPVTVLKGYDSLWYKLIRLIEDYFINKQSTVKIFEDTQPLFLKDWECFFIPFDAHLQFDKIAAKSPLRDMQEQICEELALSHVYQELQEVWGELEEELLFIKNKFAKYEVGVKLKPFESNNLQSFISLFAEKQMMTPIDYKIMLLKLLSNKELEKRRLILIEFPELYADNSQVIEFMENINLLASMGTKIIIVTNQKTTKHCNYVCNGEIINEARLENIKRKVINEVPFICDELTFIQAKNSLLRAVDNFEFNNKFLTLSSMQNEKILVLVFVMLFHLDISVNLDMTGISGNLKEFLKCYY
ncbi:hypothetical protein CU633_22230, partial [Bacillus sp. V3-13]|uniref:hypothetical protein n=1 Tax=Bacillus sp. V3-13 TaxID=2053728 RepID=UPI000CABF41B